MPEHLPPAVRDGFSQAPTSSQLLSVGASEKPLSECFGEQVLLKVNFGGLRLGCHSHVCLQWPPTAPQGILGNQIKDEKRVAPSTLCAAAKNNSSVCFGFRRAKGCIAILITWGFKP